MVVNGSLQVGLINYCQYVVCTLNRVRDET